MVAIIAIGAYMFPKQVGQILGAGTRFPNGISADSTSPTAGLVRGTDLTITDDATIQGGTFTVTTTNAATSTSALGCVQTTATSTLTPIRLLYTASTTATAISGTQAGFVLWGYGTCPF